MGQRSQTFIRIFNPAIALEETLNLSDKKKWRDEIHQCAKLKSKIEEFYSVFGKEKTCVIALHNQWAFGRTLPLVALKLLEFNKKAKDDYINPFKQSYNIQRFCNEDPHKFVEFLTHFINIFDDYALSKYTRTGYDAFWVLNYEEPETKDVFTTGDNNDGILMVDLTINKYCLMNIGAGDSTVGQLPTLEPVSAHDYIKAYYPEEMTEYFKETCEHNKYSPEKVKQELKNNVQINAKFVKRFKHFEVMTKGEIRVMFPKGEI